MPSNPHVITIIPARGGSKRVPRKNALKLAGVPLVVHSIRHALDSSSIQETYVSTDDQEIATIAAQAGAEVIWRPRLLASDTATSESALLHCLDERLKTKERDPDLVVFLQCTSPVRKRTDIDSAVATLIGTGADSLLSVVDNKKYVWTTKDGKAVSVNYDFRRRKREQDFEKQYEENGSIYVFHPSVLRSENNRLGGKISFYEMDPWSSFQIDTPEDFELAEWILTKPCYRAHSIVPDDLQLVVFDFDGVMTDNAVWVTSDGMEAVRCDRSDGLGVSLLRQLGVPMIVLSTEENLVVAARCRKLSLPCYQGIASKEDFLAEYLRSNGISAEKVAFLGNDVNDLGCLRLVGLPVVVSDAHPLARASARLVLRSIGGYGAVRELTELIAATKSKDSVWDKGATGSKAP